MLEAGACEPVYMTVAAYAMFREEPVADHWHDDPSLPVCTDFGDDPGFATEEEADAVLEATGDDPAECEIGPADVVMKVYLTASDREVFVADHGCGGSLDEAC